MLHVVESEIVLQLIVNGHQVGLLLHQLGTVQGDELHVLGRHHHTLQFVVALIVLARQDVEGELDDAVAVRRIDIGAALVALPHILQSLAGQSVDAQDLHLALHAGVCHGLIGTGGHAVVMTEHDVGTVALRNLVLY